MAEHFAAPSGTALAAGTRANPIDFLTAITSNAILPGDTVTLLGGSGGGYTLAPGTNAPVRVLIEGTAGNPITIRNDPGAKVTLDYHLQHKTSGGAYVIWKGQGLNFVLTRASDTAKAVALDLLDIQRPGVQVIHLVVQNGTQDGLSAWDAAPDTLFYGNVIYQNGYEASDRGHGHGTYTQNSSGRKQLVNNIAFQNYAMGLKAFGVQGTVIGYDVTDNISFDNGVLSFSAPVEADCFAGGDQPSDDVHLLRNACYKSSWSTNTGVGSFSIGYSKTVRCGSGSFTDNVSASGHVDVIGWSAMSFRRNKVVAPAWTVDLETVDTENVALYDWDDNDYWYIPYQNTPLFARANTIIATGVRTADTTVGRNFSAWQAQGIDATTRLTVNSRPVGAWAYVRPSTYEPGRAHIAVYNWNLAARVDVDVSGALNVGDVYEVRHVFDLWGAAVASGVYTGGTISIPMTAVAPPTPSGNGAGAGAHNTAPTPGPEFGAFVLLTTGQTQTLHITYDGDPARLTIPAEQRVWLQSVTRPNAIVPLRYHGAASDLTANLDTTAWGSDYTLTLDGPPGQGGSLVDRVTALEEERRRRERASTIPQQRNPLDHPLLYSRYRPKA